MPRPTLDVILEGDAASGWIARAPAVGVWSGIPVAGTALEAGSAGELTQAGRRFLLRVPEAAVSIVSTVVGADRRAIDVEWGQELFRLAPVSAAAERAASSAPGTVSVLHSANVLVAPTDGVFYMRPAPDANAFVSPGDTVTQGQAVGLIEVMKTFNHVLFAGDGLPAAAVVKEVLAVDGQEVCAGEPLLRYGPAG
jgi:acetyl-CoA carboxylase biotin carboxyl carrier protein